ncbi:methyltransferase domain-containing protein [Paraburkholderia sp. LEh10]|uniref:class I SAM-dependent methyltransferase n=1 Tax=Paraburkholderia sp. LEh10 TaxID=2821353 RepID=UPI001AE3E3D9|nr:class I SAM-dependent methyltransferase [Paraburkholderia sp. LEh10]MBP0591184.1 methyltransferase domain-containing protein [Paraburkholderia sp. LEh10]
MSLDFVSTTCPVCAHSLAAPFFPAGEQPLATLAWPSSAQAARDLPRHALDFVQCPACSHVWNHRFHYDAIPYESNPNRMFNNGGIWKGHLAATRDLLLAHLPPKPVVVEIGCGEGHFVRGLARARDGGRFVGFDPNASPETGKGVEFHARLFEPLTDMPTFAPNGVVIRHVLEHLTEPAKLIEQLAWGAAAQGNECWLFAEVPCIDRVFETDRLADFFYEHVSHFTTESFRTLMARAGEIAVLEQGYDGEVVYALVKLGVPVHIRDRQKAASAFSVRSIASRETIANQLSALAEQGKRVAIWGGTGKAAAFIHHFCADARRFPLVVDSDPSKAGTFVPGSGQKIEFRDVLKTAPVDVIVIPTQWRARDIIAEMAREDIAVDSVMIEHGGELVDFDTGAHPY